MNTARQRQREVLIFWHLAKKIRTYFNVFSQKRILQALMYAGPRAQ